MPSRLSPAVNVARCVATDQSTIKAMVQIFTGPSGAVTVTVRTFVDPHAAPLGTVQVTVTHPEASPPMGTSAAATMHGPVDRRPMA
jgi:hypothetical protein